MDDPLRRYLQGRISLGEPELVLPSLDRRRARRLTARVAARGLRPATTDRKPAGPVSPTPAARAGERSPGGDPGRTGPAGGGRTAGDADGRLAAEEILRLPDLEALRAAVEGCRRCPLHRTRTRAVFGEGDPDARLVCVGEAPGAREDATGRPFVGPAGDLLDRLLLAAGFRREEVYICNVLKSRPPRNRDPGAEEIEACSPFLLRQIELLEPGVIVTFGAFASRTLLGTAGSLGSLRGRVHRWRDRPLVATYHPAALLRNRSWTRPTWEDLQRARRVLEEGAPAGTAGAVGATGREDL